VINVNDEEEDEAVAEEEKLRTRKQIDVRSVIKGCKTPEAVREKLSKVLEKQKRR
jgi:hypothetical protein